MDYSDLRLRIPATLRHLNIVGAAVTALLDREEDIPEPAGLHYGVELALQEVCTNIVEHAYADRVGAIDLEARIERSPRRLEVTIADTGRRFNPDEVPAPTLGTLQVRGYGLHLIYELMDHVSYASDHDGNHWRLTKRF